VNRRSAVLLALGVGLALPGAPRAGAANFVFNGSFATNVNGWTVEDADEAAFAWNAADAAGSGSSGSARVRNFTPGPGNGIGIRQCAGAVVPGDAYSWGGKIRFPTGQGRTGFAMIGLRFKSGPNCTGDDVEQPRLSQNAPSDAFLPLSQNAIVPGGSASVEFTAFPSKVEAGGELVAFFDDLFFNAGPCVDTATAMCLSAGRFRVRATWHTTQPVASGAGQVVKITPDTGYFWFFNASNIEALVKVLDGCGLNDRYWVFAGGPHQRRGRPDGDRHRATGDSKDVPQPPGRGVQAHPGHRGVPDLPLIPRLYNQD
jgi:hypothetical protein